ncbi:hypothetical protein T265_14085, partial [Opisthorchis viverrini]
MKKAKFSVISIVFSLEVVTKNEKKSFSSNILLVPNCHDTQRKHEGWGTVRLPKPRGEKSRDGVGFEPRTFWSVHSRFNHLGHFAHLLQLKSTKTVISLLRLFFISTNTLLCKSIWFSRETQLNLSFMIFYNLMCGTLAASRFSWHDIRDVAVYFHRGNYSQFSRRERVFSAVRLLHVFHNSPWTCGEWLTSCSLSAREFVCADCVRFPYMFRQPRRVSALVLPSSGPAARHRWSATAQRLHEGWDTARLSKPGQSRGRSRVRTTDFP